MTGVASCLPYLAIRRPLVCFGHPLVHVEHTGDAQLDAVQVAADDSPQPEHARLAGLADLKGSRSHSSVGLSLSQKTQSPWTGHLPWSLQHQPNQRQKNKACSFSAIPDHRMVPRTLSWPDGAIGHDAGLGAPRPPRDPSHLHDLPWKVQNAAGSSSQEAPQSRGGPLSDGPGLWRALCRVRAPSLPAGEALPGLQLPLLLVEPEPNQPLFLRQTRDQTRRQRRRK